MQAGSGANDPIVEAMAYAEQIKRYEVVRVYRNDGRILFEGTPRQVATFWGNRDLRSNVEKSNGE